MLQPALHLPSMNSVLCEAFAELDVIIKNVGTSYTSRRRGLGSIVDLTYVSTALVSTVVGQVREDSM